MCLRQVKSARAIIASHIAWNNSNFTVDQWVRPPELKLNIPAQVFCMSWCADFEFRGTQAPIYYAEVFGLSPVAIGTLLSAPLAISSGLGNGAAAAAETFLQTRGMPLLQIRKVLSWVANGMQAGSLMLFVLGRTPLVATAGYFGLRMGQCFHGSGANASYLEVSRRRRRRRQYSPTMVSSIIPPARANAARGVVTTARPVQVGGQDTAILMAVGNTLASIPGMIIPPLGKDTALLLCFHCPVFSKPSAFHCASAVSLPNTAACGAAAGVWLKRRTGSWIPLFSLAAAVQFVAAAMYGRDCSLEPARDQIPDSD